MQGEMQGEMQLSIVPTVEGGTLMQPVIRPIASLMVVVAAALASASPAAAQPARGTIDTLTFWSQSLGIHKRALAWLPPSYATHPERRYPVAIYLHGLWGNETNWTKLGQLDRTLDSLTAGGMRELIVVMPDGDDGWYTTWNRLPDVTACQRDFRPREGDTAASYCVPWPHYDDYVARDLVAAIDRTWRTIPRREARGIAGLSMGGYGAVALALAYPDVFRAAASHSGVVSPRYAGAHPFDGNMRYAASADELRRVWGERLWPLIAPAFGSDTMGWVARDPVRLAQRLAERREAQRPAIFLDCGVDDELVDQARAFRVELERLGFTPAYAEWTGKHDWEYWRRHAPESLTWLARQLSGR